MTKVKEAVGRNKSSKLEQGRKSKDEVEEKSVAESW